MAETKANCYEEKLLSDLRESFMDNGFVYGYIEGNDEFNGVMQYLRNRGFNYSVRDSDFRLKARKNPGGGENIDINQHTIFYQLKALSIKFFGLPFTVEKTTHYRCVYGLKYYKSKASKSKSVESKRKSTVMSKKMGCIAKLTVKKIVVYPDYPLEVESDWRNKKKLIENLRQNLSSDKQVNSFYRYYLSVSVQSSHNHPPVLYDATTVTINKSKPKSPKFLKSKTKARKDNNASQWENADPSTSINDPGNFLNTFVKIPGSTFEEGKTIEIKLHLSDLEGSNNNHNNNHHHVEGFQIQFQPSVEDLQNVFKEKLKTLYTLSENCSNSALLLQLVGDLEQIEVHLSNDLGLQETIVG